VIFKLAIWKQEINDWGFSSVAKCVACARPLVPSPALPPPYTHKNKKQRKRNKCCRGINKLPSLNLDLCRLKLKAGHTPACVILSMEDSNPKALLITKSAQTLNSPYLLQADSL
jgi:hypothetical protein